MERNKPSIRQNRGTVAAAEVVENLENIQEDEEPESGSARECLRKAQSKTINTLRRISTNLESTHEKNSGVQPKVARK